MCSILFNIKPVCKKRISVSFNFYSQRPIHTTTESAMILIKNGMKAISLPSLIMKHQKIVAVANKGCIVYSQYLFFCSFSYSNDMA